MKYDAFISYRHLERDMYVAKKVHKALETTKIPRKIQKEIGRKRINRVFRDQEELPIGSDLGSNIEAALREAAFLVVICSPQTKDSYWVMKEIDTFISMHGRENILAVLVDGEPADAFPPQLLSDENGNPVEPLAADVRGESKSEVRRKLKTETLRLAASILQVDYDDLKQRHRERQMRRNICIAAGIATVAVAFGVYNAYNLSKINAEYQQKLINESKVLAATSLDILEDGDAKTAALVAMEGLATDDNKRPYVSDNVYALSQALGTYDLGLELSHDLKLSHDVAVLDFAVKEDGTIAVSVDKNNKFYIWNLDNGECIYRKSSDIIDENEDKIIAVGFSGDTIVVATNNFIRGYTEAGEIVYEYQPENKSVFAYIDKSGKYVAIKSTAYDSETFESYDYVQLVDAATGKPGKVYVNQTQVNYGAKMAFTSDSTKLMIEHMPSSDEDQNYFSIIDLQTDKIIDVPVDGGVILDIRETQDGDIAAASMSYDALMASENSPIHVVKCDASTGEVKWTKDVDYIGGPLNSSYCNLNSRILDIDGTEYGQLTINGSKKLYVLDLNTGDNIAEITTNDYIQRYMIGTANSMIMIGTADGMLTYYNGMTGEVLNNNIVEVDNSLVNFDMKNSVFVAMGYRSPELTVMRFTKDEDYIVQTEMETNFYGGAVSSPSGDTYVLQTTKSTTESLYAFRVFETATGKEVGQIEVAGARYGKVSYLDEDTIVIPTYNGSVFYYSIKDKKTDSISIDEDVISIGFAESTNGKYIVFGDENYYVIDVEARKIIYQGESDVNFFNIAISNDGKTIYGVDVYGHAYEIDAKKGKSKEVFKDYSVSIIVTSQEDNIIAVVCKDGILRVINTQTGDVENEVEYYGNQYSFVQFSKDNNQLFLQGDDLYFRIYDRVKGKTVLLMNDQINDLVYTCYDEENNRLSIFNNTDMYIIDLNTYGLLDYAEYGRLYIPQAQTIVSVYGTSVTEFKVRNQDDLVKKVKERFGDAKLSELQRLKYMVN